MLLGLIVRSRLLLKLDASRLRKNDADRYDAYVMFGVAMSLDSCTAFVLLSDTTVSFLHAHKIDANV